MGMLNYGHRIYSAIQKVSGMHKRGFRMHADYSAYGEADCRFITLR